MRSAAADVYVAAFVARCDAMRRSGQARVNHPGLLGLSRSGEGAPTRLLVTDDQAYGPLCALLGDARAGMISVFSAAARCIALLDRSPAWRSETVTAMICRDLHGMPAVLLPGELTLASVRRRAGDAPGGVSLEQAVGAAAVADLAIDNRRALAAYLRSLPPAMRLFAAVDDDGVVRATAGCGAFGAEASVIFVNTHPDWRGRGIGTAMTATALRAAQRSGARRASLDASRAGLPIYRRLGFEVVTATTRFLRTG